MIDLKKIIENLKIIKFFKYFIFETYTKPSKNIYQTLYNRAINSSVNYIEKNLNDALIFEDHKKLWLHAIKKVKKNGLFVEFGVYEGTSINFFSKNIASENIIIGFDSFEGLKEDWSGSSHSASSFDMKGKMPKVNKNVVLIKGWFEQTLPDFLDKHNEDFSFIHFDCDTFLSTDYLLKKINKRITKDTIIIFDEYIGYPNWENNEFLAWQNFVKNNNIKYKYIAFANQQAAIQII